MGHIACKSIYVRLFAGTNRMHTRDMVAVGSWIAIAFGVWVIAWIIASAIPVFNNLLSLIVGNFRLSQRTFNILTTITSHRFHSLPVGTPSAYQEYSGYG